MLAQELRSKIDKLRDLFWSGGGSLIRWPSLSSSDHYFWIRAKGRLDPYFP